MGKSGSVRDKIIDSTIRLLEETDGNLNKITIRTIAETVGIGTGLINYHFGSKDKLIEECVQRIIGTVITVFQPQLHENLDDVSRLKEVAKQVLDFLMNHPEIAKVSILGDLITPMLMDNTMKTVIGFMKTLNTEDEKMKLLTYCFTIILQGCFLRRDITKNAIGLDFNDKKERDTFVDFIVDRMYGENSV